MGDWAFVVFARGNIVNSHFLTLIHARGRVADDDLERTRARQLFATLLRLAPPAEEMPEQVLAAPLLDQDQLLKAMTRRYRLVVEFLSSEEGNLGNINVDRDLYKELAPVHGFTAKVGGGWEEQGGQISLPVERDASNGNFLVGWREGFILLTPQELTVDLRLLFGGAEAMIVTWYVAVKVDAAREGLAHEGEVVRRLNQPIDDVISLLESDDEEVFDRSVDTIGSYRPSNCKNAIILFFEQQAAECLHTAKKPRYQPDKDPSSEQEELDKAGGPSNS